jgi:hypothetical protein
MNWPETNNFDIKANTILMVAAGSRSYIELLQDK